MTVSFLNGSLCMDRVEATVVIFCLCFNNKACLNIRV